MKKQIFFSLMVIFFSVVIVGTSSNAQQTSSYILALKDNQLITIDPNSLTQQIYRTLPVYNTALNGQTFTHLIVAWENQVQYFPEQQVLYTINKLTNELNEENGLTQVVRYDLNSNEYDVIYETMNIRNLTVSPDEQNILVLYSPNGSSTNSQILCHIKSYSNCETILTDQQAGFTIGINNHEFLLQKFNRTELLRIQFDDLSFTYVVDSTMGWYINSVSNIFNQNKILISANSYDPIYDKVQFLEYDLSTNQLTQLAYGGIEDTAIGIKFSTENTYLSYRGLASLEIINYQTGATVHSFTDSTQHLWISDDELLFEPNIQYTIPQTDFYNATSGGAGSKAGITDALWIGLVNNIQFVPVATSTPSPTPIACTHNVLASSTSSLISAIVSANTSNNPSTICLGGLLLMMEDITPMLFLAMLQIAL